jgi:hypothetical protein
MYSYYKKGMEMAGRPAWSNVKDEIDELLEDKSFEEFIDVIHSLGRFCNFPLPILWIICRKTALKHAKRVEERDCPRSLRNCAAAGETCCCRK